MEWIWQNMPKNKKKKKQHNFNLWILKNYYKTK